MRKIGSYNISDWIEDHPNLHYMYIQHELCDSKTDCIDVFYYEDKWFFIITSPLFSSAHLNMFSINWADLEFLTLEDTKSHIDNFLNKLDKLKAFL